MKKLLIIIMLLVSTKIISQDVYYLGMKEDKFYHVCSGYGIGFISNCIGYEVFKNKTAGFVSGLVCSTLAGILKENYDKNNSKNFSKPDLFATICGGIAGTVTIRLVLWNSIHRKKASMEQYFLITD